MRILIDECVTKKLRRHLQGHEFRSVREMGWLGKQNGELLALMLAAGFQAILTVDRNLPHQQNILASGVAVLVMTARRIRVQDLLPLLPEVYAALATIQPGEVVEVVG